LTDSPESATAPSPSDAPPALAVEVVPAAPVVYWGDPQMPVAAGPAPGYVYAGFWRRVAAGLIDGFIFTIFWTFGAFAILVPAMRSLDYSVFQFDPVTGQPLATPEEMNAAFAPLLGPLLVFYGLVLIIVAVYNIVLWAWLGGTIGQRALGMEVRRESDGRRIGFWRACLRYLGYIVASIPFAIGIFWIGLDPRKQGWHDKIARTLVVRRT
jgi:uncharacterized RDD family membrane protein YckC